MIPITERKPAEEDLGESKEAAQRLARENAILAEIGRIISSTLNIDDVYKLFSEEVKKLLPFERIVINLIDLEGNKVVNRYVEGISAPERNQKEVFPITGTTTEAVTRDRKGLIIQLKDENRVIAKFPGLLPEIRAGLRSFLSVPLISRDEAIGGLHFRSKKYNAYSEQDLRIAESIANQIAGAIANAQLFTERQRAEEALRVSEERYRNLFNNAQIGLYQTRISDGLVLEVNLRAAQLYGYKSREECIGDYVASEHYIDPGTRERLLMELQKNGEVKNWEARLTRRDGSIYWSRFSCRIHPEKGYIEGVAADITEEKLTGKKLRESEERYRLLVENSPLGIISVSRQGQIMDVNPVFLSILGSTSEREVRAINIFNYAPLVETGIAGNVRRCLEYGEAGIYETPHTSKWGKEVFFRYHLTPIRDMNSQITGVQAIVEDISDKKKLEAQLFQAQKMEAIGTLAGGIAHDFNNILAAMMGYAELASLDAPEGSKANMRWQEVLKAGLRARDLVQQILTFSRQSSQERKPVEIGPIVKETLKLLRASLPSTVEIRQHVESNADVIETDPTQIHQVLMNLCTNAAHAMRESGGTLEVSLSKVDMQGSTTTPYPDLHAGPYVRLSVSDTGHGIPPQLLKRIFDPYFTTKPVGEGTGLGLAVVHGIVKSHGGEITVSSKPGKGTTFHVYLPGTDGPQEVAASQRVEPYRLGRQECLLLIDDEQALVDVGKQMLEHLGYRVIVRTSSVEALELFRNQPEKFDLVITDMTMPNMTGDKLAREMMGIRPGMPIILCTGFSEHIAEEKVKKIGIREFVMKPLVMSDLSKTIRRVLDQK
jgi:PAS domain S-box-containing protein